MTTTHRSATPARHRRRPRRAGPTTLLGILGILAVLALIVAACGDDDDGGSVDGGGDGGDASASDCPVDALDGAEGPVEVVLWHGIIGLAAQTVDEFAAEYNSLQDQVEIRVESQGDYNEQLKKFRDALRQPETLPTLMMAEETNFRFLVDSQTLVAADSCLEADPDAVELYEAIDPAIRSYYTIDGTTYPGAYSVSTPVLYYNRAHFEQAGLDPDDPPATLEEMRAAAEAIKAARPDGTPFSYRADSWWIEQLSTAEGDAVVDQDNGHSGLAEESLVLNDSVDAWTSWAQAMTEDGLMKTAAYSATFDAYFAVANESSSMLVETSTAATTVDALITGTLDAANLGLDEGTDLSGLQFPNLDADVGELPGLSGAGSGSVGGNGWYLIGAGRTPEQIAGAWDFLKWINEPEQQVKWTEQGSYLPITEAAKASPELEAYFTDTRPGQWLATATESLGNIDPDFAGPIIGPYAEFRTALRSATEDALIGGQPIDRTFEEANTTIQAALDDYALDVGG